MTDAEQPKRVRRATGPGRADLLFSVALKDYETIARMRDEVVSVGENRLNFFLATIVGARGVPLPEAHFTLSRAQIQPHDSLT